MKKSKKVFAMNDDYGAGDGLLSLDYALSEAGQEDAAAAAEATVGRDLTAQVDEVVRGLSGARVGGQVYLIDVRQLEPYPDQPFRQYPPDKLQELAEDIGRVGVLSPILTRRRGNRLQILAGHNRWTAAKMAGLTHVPVMVLEADDDQAILVLTSTNLRQREQLLPSEKAYAYKLQMDALKRQGQRMGGERTSTYITRQTGESRMQIHRFVRLTELVPELLDLLDRGKITITPAVAVSYLLEQDQKTVYRYLREHGGSLTIDRANRLKNLAAEHQGALGPLPIQEVLGRGRDRAPLREEEQLRGEGSTVVGDEVRIPFERLRRYLPEGISAADAEMVILEALRVYAGR